MKIRHIAAAGLTIAYTENKKDGAPKTFLDVGISVCSKKDQFTRKRGFQIATGRLQRTPYVIPGNIDTMRHKDVCQYLLDTSSGRDTSMRRALKKAIANL